MLKCLAPAASMTLSLTSQGITVFPLPDAFSSTFQDVKQSIMGWGGKRRSTAPCFQRGEVRSCRTLLAQVKSIRMTVWHQVILQKKIAMISTAKGTGAGWIFVRVLACVGWGWLGFFAFTQINLEMECRGASFIVAQLRKMLICSFCEGLGDNVPLAFTVAAHFSTMDTSVCFFFAHSWGMYVSSIYVVCFLCISDLLFSLFRQSLLTD